MLQYLLLLLVLLIITIALEIIYKNQLAYSFKERLLIVFFIFSAYAITIGGVLFVGSGFSSNGFWFSLGALIGYVIASNPLVVWLSYLIIPYFIVTIIYKTITLFIKK
jgi:hypothetical protein